MLFKIFRLSIISLMGISSALFSAINYEIQDIGTLQTHSSEAIAINNKGQILGWYNLDGTPSGKHFFVRDKDGTFNEIQNFNNWTIDWKYLADNGKAYGKFDGSVPFGILLVWDIQNGVANLGALPGPEISAINNAGQVLIKSIAGTDQGGRPIRYPVIWHNGQITKLKGIEADLGVESNDTNAFDINNNGDVVGQSLVELVYKNKIYQQTRPVLWSKGRVVDLYHTIPKADVSSAIALNDLGDILISSAGYTYITINGIQKAVLSSAYGKITSKYVYCNERLLNKTNSENITDLLQITKNIVSDYDSIWMNINGFNNVNDLGEIVARGQTIYHENHAMLLTPIQTK